MPKDEAGKPIVGLSACSADLDGVPNHTCRANYIRAVARAGCLPIVLPAIGPAMARPELLDSLDGLVLTGSVSNVDPAQYGEPRDNSKAYDEARDETVLSLIRAGLRRDLPILAICRGLHELNVALGGSLFQNLHAAAGKSDHREDESQPRSIQYAPVHRVRLAPGGTLRGIVGADEIKVSSLHWQGIDRLGDRLAIEAVADDGLVEAVTLRELQDVHDRRPMAPRMVRRRSSRGCAVSRLREGLCRPARASICKPEDACTVCRSRTGTGLSRRISRQVNPRVPHADRFRRTHRSRYEMVPLAGLEPARCFHHLILSQARLPIPPQGQPGIRPRPKIGGACVGGRIIATGGAGQQPAPASGRSVPGRFRPAAGPPRLGAKTDPFQPLSRRPAMNEEAFNMSLRKFLKVVGVTSQQEIEKAVRAARRRRPPQGHRDPHRQGGAHHRAGGLEPHRRRQDRTRISSVPQFLAVRVRHLIALNMPARRKLQRRSEH